MSSLDFIETVQEKNNSSKGQNISKTIGLYLRTKRESAGLTQAEVAEKLGYGSPQFISNIERGISNIPVKSLKTIIALYNIDTNEIIELILNEKRAILVKELSPN